MATNNETGTSLNQTLVNYTETEFNKLLDAGRALVGGTTGNIPDDVIGIGPNEDGEEQYIKVDDQQKYDALLRLNSFLEFDPVDPNNTYEIPGVIIRQGGQVQTVALYVPVSKAKRLANIASDLEQKLGIELPVQLHQLKDAYDNSFIPGTTDKPLPTPKLYGESVEAYEDRLKAAYDGVVPEERDDGLFRQPYAHEKVNYRVNDQVVTTGAVPSAYYNNQVGMAAMRNLGGPNNGGNQNNSIHSGQRLRVNESDDVEKTPLGQKIGRGLSSFETFFKNGALWKKIGISAAVLGVGGTAVAGLVMTNPALLATVLLGGGVIGGSIALSRKVKKSLSGKVNNWLYGSPITNTNEGERTQGQPTPTPTPTPEPTQTPTPTPRPNPNPTPTPGSNPTPPPQPGANPNPNPQPGAGQPSSSGGAGQPTAQEQQQIDIDLIDGWLNSLGADMDLYREIETKVALAQDAVDSALTEDARKEAEKILAELKDQQRGYLIHLSDMMSEIVNNFTQTGGRSL